LELLVGAGGGGGTAALLNRKLLLRVVKDLIGQAIDDLRRELKAEAKQAKPEVKS